MRRGALAVAALLSLPPFALAQAPTTTGSTFRITPQHSVAELEKQALASRPPKEQGEFRKPDLVELVRLDPRIKLDIRYATTNNFLSTPMYSQARAFLQRPAAEALVRVEHAVEKRGYGLLVHDAYRPWYVTKMFWDATPDDKKIFVADPREGSKHNRGCAVDLTLYDLKSGAAVEMPSGYDEMSKRAYADYPGGTAEQRERREFLRAAMEHEGFTVYPQEWWHFDYKDWKQYPIMNVKFEDLRVAGYRRTHAAETFSPAATPAQQHSADGGAPMHQRLSRTPVVAVAIPISTAGYSAPAAPRCSHAASVPLPFLLALNCAVRSLLASDNPLRTPS